MKNCKKLIAILMVAALMLSCVVSMAQVVPTYPEVPDGYDGFVTISVSAATIGWGYLVTPMLVPVHNGESVAQATVRLFDTLSIGYIAGSMENFYLSNISCQNCLDGVAPNVPDYLMEQLELYPGWAEENFGYSYGEWTGIENGNGMLGEGDFSDFAGWMIAEDNISLPVGAGSYSVQVGCSYQWGFTVYGWGMDLGWSNGWGSFPVFDNPAEGVNRSEAEKAVAMILADETLSSKVDEGGVAHTEFVNLESTLENIASSQEQIDDCLTQLLNALEDNTLLIGDVNGDGAVNMQDAQLVLRHSMGLMQLSDEAIAAADVNGDGNINSADATLIVRIALGLV